MAPESALASSSRSLGGEGRGGRGLGGIGGIGDGRKVGGGGGDPVGVVIAKRSLMDGPQER